jgi:hypothetical protein
MAINEGDEERLLCPLGRIGTPTIVAYWILSRVVSCILHLRRVLLQNSVLLMFFIELLVYTFGSICTHTFKLFDVIQFLYG